MMNVDVNNWAILGGILLVNIPAPWSIGVRGHMNPFSPVSLSPKKFGATSTIKD